MKRSVVTCAVLLTFLLPFPVSLFSFQVEVSEEQKIKVADVVMVGKVIGKESYWNAARDLIYTDYRVGVTNMLKGPSTAQEVVFRALGGQVGAVQLIVTDQPELNEGDEAILYLRANKEGKLETTYGRQGARLVVSGVVEESGETLKAWMARVSVSIRNGE